MKFLKFPFTTLFFALIVSMSFIACESDDDDDMIIADKDKTITEYLQTAEEFSTLRTALDRTNLSAILNDDDTDFTLFAPNNDAFEAAGINVNEIDTDALMDVLLYHVVAGNKIKEVDLLFDDRYYTTESTAGIGGNKLSIMIDKESGTLFINGMAAISDSENDFDNGVIYELGSVLALPTVTSVIANDADLQNLEGALSSVDGLADTFDDGEEYTLFAPVNDGFDDIEDVVEGLNSDQVGSILTYHLLEGIFNGDNLNDDDVITTVNGETIKIDVDFGNTEIEDANGDETRIKIGNIYTTNGLIHIIDDVLLPSEY